MSLPYCFAAMFIVFAAAPGFAQDELPYSDDPVQACLEEQSDLDPTACAGQSSDMCMGASEAGSSTYGMSFCLGKEAEFWDARLNQLYSELVAFEKTKDIENQAYGADVVKAFPALRDMQRAWVAYRDALCGYEYSQWGGGTGGGPAYTSCTLHETARQVSVLRGYLNGGE